jgi:hypothetical protein
MTRDYWTFLTNHGHVLVCLAADPDMVLREVATRVGITERAVQQIVRDLELAGVIARVRVGRRNRYVICSERGFRHTLEAEVTLGSFLGLVAGDGVAPGCPAEASAGSCPIAAGPGCPLAATELARRSAIVLRSLPAV